MIKTLNILDKYITLIVIFLYPLFFLPIFTNTFEISKLFLLTIGVLLISIIKIIKNISSENLKFKVSFLDLFVLLFSLTYFVSAIFVSPNKADAFFFPGTASFVIFGAILYSFISQFDVDAKKQVNLAIALSALIFGIIEILSFTGLIKGNLTTFGSIINSFGFLITALSISIFEILRNKNSALKVLFSVASFIIFISAFTTIYSILPGRQTTPNIPGLKASWSVAIDSLKESPLLGVGPSNFQYSYGKYRPITTNSTQNWSLKYMVARNTPLTIISEVGMLGIIFYIGLFVVSIGKLKITSLDKISAYKIGLISIFVISFIYPFSPSFVVFIFVILALSNESHDIASVFNSKIPALLVSLPFLVLIIISAFLGFKAFYPEYLFYDTLKLVAKNDAVKAYETINRVVKINPYVDRYHLVYADISMAIGQSLAKKENLTEEDKKTLTQLIQQSIRENKAAVSLNISKSSTWENLGNTYLEISPFVKEANSFAIQSYNQAIFLDPINPTLRIKLGGVYYASGNYEDAIKIFDLAVLAKPDFANSHYNLAMAYKGNNQIDKAKEQMEIVLKLVDQNSNDYSLAKKELDSLNSDKKKAETETTSTENLTAPLENQNPVIDPQIELPKEEQPTI